MGAPRYRPVKQPARIPDRVVRQVFRRLREDGSLAVVLDVLRDHRDTLGRRIQVALGAELLVDRRALARCWARQGALDEVARLVSLMEALGAEDVVPESHERHE